MAILKILMMMVLVIIYAFLIMYDEGDDNYDVETTKENDADSLESY